MFLPTGTIESNGRQLWELVLLPVGLASSCVAFTALFFAIVPPTHNSATKGLEIFCKPDGSVVLPFGNGFQSLAYNNTGYQSTVFRAGKYTPAWDPTQLLNVVFGMGELSFSAAKAIDFCWDLLVGRCGQLMLAAFVYNTVRKSALLATESSDLVLPVVTTTLTQTLGLGMMFRTVYYLGKVHWYGWRWLKWRVIAIAFACGYVTLFASFASIMTGYQAKLKPYVQLPGGQTQLPTDELKIPSFVVIDGSRIGLRDNYPIMEHSMPSALPIAEYFDVSHRILTASVESSWPQIYQHWAKPQDFHCTGEPEPCSFAITQESVVMEAVDSTNGGGSIFCSNNLTWHDTIWQLDSTLDIFKQRLSQSQILTVANNQKKENDQFWYAIDGEAVRIDWVAKNSVCQTLNHYQWGFSSLLLFAFCIHTVLFAIAVTFLQLELYWHGRANRLQDNGSAYHTILALADELKTVLTGQPRYWTDMSGPELTAAVRNRLVTVDVGELPLSRHEERQATKEPDEKKHQLLPRYPD